ncbi:hypothetical protein ACLB1G_17495 [Oxalobacteraceae bacterium A2-2]
MQRVLIFLSVLGVVLFGGLHALSYADTPLVERAAREVLRIEVERRVGDKIDALSGARIAGLARRVLGDADAELALQRARAGAAQQVAQVVDRMLDPACECRKRLAGYRAAIEDARLGALGAARDRMLVLIEASYAHVSQQLLREVRIFTGTNAVMFALLGLAAGRRGRAGAAPLLLPATVLLGSAALCAGFYLFGQDWLHTIVYGRYVGMAYAAYAALLGALLADILLNRARVSRQVLGMADGALPAAAC